MENKNVRYLLAVAVLAIWGLLGYRIYQKMNPGNDFVAPPPPVLAVTEVEKDSFTLLVNYPDPFLGTRIPLPEAAPAPANPSNSTTVIPPKISSPPATAVFPQIVYKGLIALKNGRKAALATVDGKTMNWGWGENYEEMTLLDIQEDSIRVRYQEEEKTILKAR